MSTRDGKNSGRASEECPICQKIIVMKPVGDSLLSFEPDGSVHWCQALDSRPLTIGETIQGKIIDKFILKHRRITLILSDSMVLEIYASSGEELVAMNMTLITPDGVREERK